MIVWVSNTNALKVFFVNCVLLWYSYTLSAGFEKYCYLKKWRNHAIVIIEEPTIW